MGWFQWLFAFAFVGALITKKAFFRGFVTAEENPEQYRKILICYAVLAASGFIFRGIDRFSPWGFPVTDAATRLAYDIERQVVTNSKGPASYIIEHKLKAFPEGCSDGYSVEMFPQSLLLVRCQEGGSYSTSYHLNFVQVPTHLKATKSPGEKLELTIENQNCRPAITGLK